MLTGSIRKKLPLLLALAALLAGCSSSEPTIVIGSKNFTESLLLGELLAQHIEARTNLTVERRLNLGGTFLCHEALRRGQLDIYPEYTGTALRAILQQPVEQNSSAVFEDVAEAYRNQFDIHWMPPFGFNNTYAIVVRAEDAERHDLRTVSDLRRVGAGWTIGFGFEFFEREDGFHGFIERYDLTFAGEPKAMDLNLVYRALRDGGIGVGVGNSTDGLISVFDLKVLEDDRNYFPPYDAAPLVRLETLKRHPDLEAVLAELEGLLSEEKMRKVNYQVDGEHRSVEEVVLELRQNQGLL